MGAADTHQSHLRNSDQSKTPAARAHRVHPDGEEMKRCEQCQGDLNAHSYDLIWEGGTHTFCLATCAVKWLRERHYDEVQRKLLAAFAFAVVALAAFLN
jgi:hypothetical protein